MKAKEMTDLYWFCQSVEYGGFAQASAHNRVSAPTLSRAVAHLEGRLGEKLLHRSAKQFQLTVAGEEYYKRFAPVFSALQEQWGLLTNLQPELTGDIRVSCPEPFADSFLQQLAVEFMAEHPGVNIHIEFSSDTESFVDDRIDLAVSTNPPKAPNLMQRRLFDLKLALAASPTYLADKGQPERLEDLHQHQLLAGNTIPFWEFRQAGESVRIPLKPKYSVDSLRLVIKAACAGAGICLIPEAILGSMILRKELEVVLPDVEIPLGKVYLVWADRKLVSTRVTAFRTLIIERLQGPLGFLSSITKST